MTIRACRFCGNSGRQGYVVCAEYFDRMERTDVIGEYRLTSGVEWGKCFHCHGTGQQSQEEWGKTPEPPKREEAPKIALLGVGEKAEGDK